MIRVYALVDPRATSPADKPAPGANRKWIHGESKQVVPQQPRREVPSLCPSGVKMKQKNTHVLNTEPQITHLLDEKRSGQRNCRISVFPFPSP